MAITLNDNLGINAGKPVDSKYLSSANTPYASVSAVNTAIVQALRYIGLTVNINNVEYWYGAGTLNTDLVIKTSTISITGGTNGLSTSGNNVILGGTITSNVDINVATNHFINIGCNVAGGILRVNNDPITCGISLASKSGILGNSLSLVAPDGRIILYSASGSTQKEVCFDYLHALQYCQNYASSYTNRSIPDVEYVNSAILASGGTIYADNGLSISGTSIVLGGTLFDSTIITDARLDKKGIEYGGDYSSSFTARSLPDVAYVNSVASGLRPKAAVAVATTGDTVLSGLLTVDGYTVSNGDRVLVKDQSNGVFNGVYIASASTWTRASDMNSSGNTVTGSYTYVLTGDTNKNTAWVLVSPSPIIVGTDIITFVLFNKIIDTTGTVTGATNGLTKIGGDIVLGGDLINDTSINLQTNCLSIINQATTPMLFVDPVGDVAYLNTASGVTVCVNGANNEIDIHTSNTNYGNNTISLNTRLCQSHIELKNTCINLSGSTVGVTGSFSLSTPSNGACTDTILVWNSTDHLVKKVPYITGSTGNITGATNGLSVCGKNVILGGNALCKNTIISGATFCLGISNSKFKICNNATIDSYSGYQISGDTILSAGIDTTALQIGKGSISRVAHAISMGCNACSCGTQSLAFGFTAKATGATSIAIGTLTRSIHTNTIAIGCGAFVNSSDSIAIGGGSCAINNAGAIALGSLNIASGSSTVAVGYNSRATALYSTVLGGFNSCSTATETITIGICACSTGIGAIAIGSCARATTNTTVAIGTCAGFGNTGAGQTLLGYTAGLSATAICQIAIGTGAGRSNTGTIQIAIGGLAGCGNTGTLQLVIGNGAGFGNTGACQIAIGGNAGLNNRGNLQIALGNDAGNSNCNVGHCQVAIGHQAGFSNSGCTQVAIGYQAGCGNRNHNQTAIGFQAGRNNLAVNQTVLGTTVGVSNRGINQIAIGSLTGQFNISTAQIAIGSTTANFNSGSSQIAIGNFTGCRNCGAEQIAIGSCAGQSNKGGTQIAIGCFAGCANTGSTQVAIGYGAGFGNCCDNQIAIGHFAGRINRGSCQVAIGECAGFDNRCTLQVAIGHCAGCTNKGNQQVTIGLNSGASNVGDEQNAMGSGAGSFNSGTSQTAIGTFAGCRNCGTFQIAMGCNAGYINRGNEQIAIGTTAGQCNKGCLQVSIGRCSGFKNSGNTTIGIGNFAGFCNLSIDQIAIGNAAGYCNLNEEQIAIGTGAGQCNRGTNQVAIGMGAGNANSGNTQIAIGNSAGDSNSGDCTIGIGLNATSNNSGNYVIAIGESAASNNISDYKFILKQSAVNNAALICGDFATGCVEMRCLTLTALSGATSSDVSVDTSGKLQRGSGGGSLIKSVCILNEGANPVSYNVVGTDYFIGAWSLPACGLTVILPTPASAYCGMVLVVADICGNAGLYPITISGSIVSWTTTQIDTCYGSMSLISNGTQWNVIGFSPAIA